MARVQLVVQSRLLSSRLPAKALLPIADIPCVILCAKRASNTGLPVVIATSDHPSDDAIASLASEHGISFVRGSEEDVVARFEKALTGLPDETIVVRLTADNVFPDGSFIGALISAFEAGGYRYLGTGSPQDGLPYGLSAEVFRAGDIRETAAKGHQPGDREHVTPYIRRQPGAHLFSGSELGLADRSYLRCTVDSPDDYLRVRECFSGVSDPVAIGWSELVDRLAELPGAPAFRIPFRSVTGQTMSVMSLGAVQLGLPYGRANTSGMPALEEAQRMVLTAIQHGVTHIDTARAYGESESRLGVILRDSYRDRVKVITKLAPLTGLGKGERGNGSAEENELRFEIESSVLRSLRELRVHSIGTLLLHRWTDRDAAWPTLLEMRDAGLIGKLGASVYGPEEALEALSDPEVSHIQLPFNLLDGRWGAVREAALARPNVVIHARSVYLQGLLVSAPDSWPRVEGVDPGAMVVKLEKLGSELGMKSRAQLCVAHALAQDWIHSVVVGSETEAQVAENLELFRTPPLADDQLAIVQEAVGEVPAALLDPRQWSRN